ncbi:MAG: hypothetical protein J5828_00830 [Desulfovibrionaceae bacterium]|nr:hypothetical protein [Desulfovibrionaceae bacterium]
MFNEPAEVSACIRPCPIPGLCRCKDLPQDFTPEQKRLLIDFDPLNMVNDR